MDKEWADFKERMLLVIFIFLVGISQRLGVFGLSNNLYNNVLVGILIMMWFIAWIQSLFVNVKLQKQRK